MTVRFLRLFWSFGPNPSTESTENIGEERWRKTSFFTCCSRALWSLLCLLFPVREWKAEPAQGDLSQPGKASGAPQHKIHRKPHKSAMLFQRLEIIFLWWLRYRNKMLCIFYVAVYFERDLRSPLKGEFLLWVRPAWCYLILINKKWKRSLLFQNVSCKIYLFEGFFILVITFLVF